MGWKEEFLRLMFDEVKDYNDMEKDDKFKEAISLYEKNKPKTIFRYRKGNMNDINTLQKDQIWLSRLNAVNDMFEGTFEVTMNKQKFNFTFLEEGLQNYIIEELETIKEKFYLACFCEDLTSVPMWSYYSDYHKGFCIEYGITEFNQCVFPVVYSNKKSIDIDDLSIPSVQKNLSIKDMNWSIENEWRILEPRPSNSGIGIKMKQPKPIGIYLGVESDQNDNLEKNLKKYCNKNNVPLHKMKVDKIKRKLYAEQIL